MYRGRVCVSCRIPIHIQITFTSTFRVDVAFVAASPSSVGGNTFFIGFWFIWIGSAFLKNLSFTYFRLTASFDPRDLPRFTMLWPDMPMAWPFHKKLLFTYSYDTPITFVIFCPVFGLRPNLSAVIYYITKMCWLFPAALFLFASLSKQTEKDGHKKLLASVEFAQLDRTHNRGSRSTQLVEAIRTSQNTTFYHHVSTTRPSVSHLQKCRLGSQLRTHFVLVSLEKCLSGKHHESFSNQSFSPHFRFQSYSKVCLAKARFQLGCSFILNKTFRFLWQHLINFQIRFFKLNECFILFSRLRKNILKLWCENFIVWQRLWNHVTNLVELHLNQSFLFLMSLYLFEKEFFNYFEKNWSIHKKTSSIHVKPSQKYFQWFLVNLTKTQRSKETYKTEKSKGSQCKSSASNDIFYHCRVFEFFFIQPPFNIMNFM